MINLNQYQSVRTSIFVRIEVDRYSVNGINFYREILRFSDHNQSIIINNENYIPLGKLLSVSSSQSDLRPSSNTVTISVSGIPDSSMQEIYNSKIKGSSVQIYRGFFTPDSNTLIGEVYGRFVGIINNYGFEEDYRIDERLSSNVIQFECSSTVDLLSQKIAGRKTNPRSMKSFYPGDLSMDRVPNLVGTSFNFGAGT